jgi:DNA-binding transcriptional regulator YiaG
VDFSATVKLVREKMNMSQEDLARALNVSFATINRWENGKTHPNKMAKQVFISFCELNGISIKD